MARFPGGVMAGLADAGLHYRYLHEVDAVKVRDPRDGVAVVIATDCFALLLRPGLTVVEARGAVLEMVEARLATARAMDAPREVVGPGVRGPDYVHPLAEKALARLAEIMGNAS